MKKEPQGDQIHDIQGFNFIDMTSSKQCTGPEPDIIDIFQKVCGFYTSTDSRKHLTSFRFNCLDHYFLLVPHHPPPLLMVLLLPWLQAKSPVYLILPVLLVPVAGDALLTFLFYTFITFSISLVWINDLCWYPHLWQRLDYWCWCPRVELVLHWLWL